MDNVFHKILEKLCVVISYSVTLTMNIQRCIQVCVKSLRISRFWLSCFSPRNENLQLLVGITLKKLLILKKNNFVLNLSDNLMFNTYDVVIKSTVTW